mgnify:CR=1 FL=1
MDQEFHSSSSGDESLERDGDESLERTNSGASIDKEESSSFPGLLPEPVPAMNETVRRISWIIAVGLILSVFFIGAFIVGWIIRGEGDSEKSEFSTYVPTPIDVEIDVSQEPVVVVAERVSPSVVLVTAPGISQGSGIVLDTQGRVVTNAHVVAGAEELQVLLPSGRQVEAEVIGFDVRRDVAVLQLAESFYDLKVAEFTSSESIRVGQLAVAVGSPFELDQTVTAGIVSAVGRVVPAYGCQVSGFRSAECSDVAMIQTDAPINPGNSGGPLADRSGRVIGMNTSIRTEGFMAANAGVGFAIPSDTVLVVAERLILGQPVGTAFLGISGITPRDGRTGALVTEVVKESPADRAGLKIDDLIVGSDGRPIPNMRALRADIQLRLPETKVRLSYLRDGSTIETTLQLASFDEELEDQN